jgi:hypothetical protein
VVPNPGPDDPKVGPPVVPDVNVFPEPKAGFVGCPNPGPDDPKAGLLLADDDPKFGAPNAPWGGACELVTDDVFAACDGTVCVCVCVCVLCSLGRS